MKLRAILFLMLFLLLMLCIFIVSPVKNSGPEIAINPSHSYLPSIQTREITRPSIFVKVEKSAVTTSTTKVNLPQLSRTTETVPTSFPASTKFSLPEIENESLDEKLNQNWMFPVASEIIELFDMSQGKYGAGNRGIKFDTEKDQIVRSVASGVVEFAGNVAGNKFVTVKVQMGSEFVFVTYGYLTEVLVAKGDSILQGQLIGKSDINFHFSVRNSSKEYIDPMNYLPNRNIFENS